MVKGSESIGSKVYFDDMTDTLVYKISLLYKTDMVLSESTLPSDPANESVSQLRSRIAGRAYLMDIGYVDDLVMAWHRMAIDLI